MQQLHSNIERWVFGLLALDTFVHRNNGLCTQWRTYCSFEWLPCSTLVRAISRGLLCGTVRICLLPCIRTIWIELRGVTAYHRCGCTMYTCNADAPPLFINGGCDRSIGRIVCFRVCAKWGALPYPGISWKTAFPYSCAPHWTWVTRNGSWDAAAYQWYESRFVHIKWLPTYCWFSKSHVRAWCGNFNIVGQPWLLPASEVLCLGCWSSWQEDSSSL